MSERLEAKGQAHGNTLSHTLAPLELKAVQQLKSEFIVSELSKAEPRVEGRMPWYVLERCEQYARKLLCPGPKNDFVDQPPAQPLALMSRMHVDLLQERCIGLAYCDRKAHDGFRVRDSSPEPLLGQSGFQLLARHDAQTNLRC